MDAAGERWFEDFAPGLVIETGGATITESQILDFAMRWDPQPFHLDVPAAAESPYGGLIASGFHTLVVGFRLYIEAARCRRSSIGSPGIEALRWLRPVRPGDTIRVRAEVVSARPSASRPDRGSALIAGVMSNQAGEPVLDYRFPQMFLKRPV